MGVLKPNFFSVRNMPFLRCLQALTPDTLIFMTHRLTSSVWTLTPTEYGCELILFSIFEDNSNMKSFQTDLSLITNL